MNSIHLQQTLPQVFADRNSVTSDIWHQDLIFRKGEMCLIEAASGTVKWFVQVEINLLMGYFL